MAHDDREQPDVSRRDLSALLGLLGGGAALSALASCSSENGSNAVPEPLGRQVEAVTGTNIVWFDTIVAAACGDGTTLVTDPGPSDAYQVAIVFGYRTPGDGGGGVFYWDYTDTTTDPDFGTVFNAAIPLGSECGSPGPGRWKRIYSGPFNVRWFGATGNGSTPDDQAIQLAITAATSTGGAVFLPRGQYVISNTLTISGTTSGVALSGEGKGAATLLNHINVHADGGTGTQSNPCLLISASGNYFIIEGLTFQGNNETGSSGNGNAISVINPQGGGITVLYPAQVIIRDCVISSHRGQGVSWNGASLPTGSAGLYAYGGTALYVENCTIVGCGAGLFGDTFEKAGIHTTTFDSCDSNGLYLTNCTQWSIHQSVLNGSGNGASTQGLAYLTGCTTVTFHGCRLKNGGPCCVNLFDNPPGSPAPPQVNTNISLYGCDIAQLNSSGLGAGQTAIKVGNGCSGFIVDGCNFLFVNSDSGAYGIDLEQSFNTGGYEASGHLYRGNSFSIGWGGTIVACINVDVTSNSAYGVLIEGNTFGQWAGVSVATTISNGVYLGGNAKACTIRNNVFATPGSTLTITNAIYVQNAATCQDLRIENNAYSIYGGVINQVNSPTSSYTRIGEGGLDLNVDTPVAVAPANGGTVSPDLASGRTFLITAGAGVSSFTIANAQNYWVPGNGARFRFVIKNESGGALTVHWGGSYKEAFVEPGNGMNRTIEFFYDAAAAYYYEMWHTPTDVSN